MGREGFLLSRAPWPVRTYGRRLRTALDADHARPAPRQKVNIVEVEYHLVPTWPSSAGEAVGLPTMMVRAVASHAVSMVLKPGRSVTAPRLSLREIATRLAERGHVGLWEAIRAMSVLSISKAGLYW
jgi:hypothetical protein